ncbi:hypothetical protein BD626DRAFT_503772 [Schizophyllum amplum]|uniref:F-box domain-containing protein n=1 Tax=Schizophyllum amplum TaxID=97359 RepID=A0A550C7J3_9AGAR|nr:hypothetical protein BD626DRAFT_503772 [Auriculariopsis ampla]
MITMHALQDLEIGFCLPEQIPYFFNHVDAPILSNLRLRGNGDGSGDVLFLNTWPHEQFKDFLSRLHYPLTSLSLIDINLQSSDIQKILTHLPALVSLAVQHTHISYDRHNTLPLYATFNAMAASPHSTAALLPRLTSLSLHGRMKIDFQLLAYMVKSRRRSPHIPLKDLDLVLLKGSSVMDEATKGRLEAACHLTYQRRDSS